MTEPGNIWVVIPAYNEEASITKVVSDLHSLNFRTLVVDDGSKDKTVEQAKLAGADETISLGKNLGYEAALNVGLLAAAQKADCRWCVTFDADAQFDASDIKKLIDLAENQGARVAVGSRPMVKRWSERIVIMVISGVSGLKDPLCGLKCFQADVVLSNTKSAGRRINMELAAKVSINKTIKVVQAEVALLPRQAGISLFSRNFSGTLRITLNGFGMIPSLLWWRFNSSLPSKTRV